MGAFRQYYKHQAKENRSIKGVDCNYPSAEFNNLILERKSSRGIRNFKSREIKKPFDSNEKIWRPWEAPVGIGKLPFNCRFSDCDVTFKRESELKRHESSIHDRITENCKICSKIFTRKDNLTRHMKTKHKNSDHKPKCVYCNKQLSRQDAVQRHVITCPKNSSKLNQRNQVENLQKPVAENNYYVNSESSDAEGEREN